MALCWNYKWTVISTIIYAIFDLTLTTVLYGQGVDYHFHFVTDFYAFDPYRSLVELWVFGLGRFVILLGGVIGFACNPMLAVPRAACIKPAVVALLVTMWMYTNVKLLMYVEDQTDMKQPWFWTLYAWSNISLMITYLLWANISNQKVPLYKEKRQKQFVINDDNVENRILCEEEDSYECSEDEDEDEESGDKDGPSSMKLVGRLLKLSLPDWHLVLPAFIFITIAQAGEAVGPYYTGQAVQGVFIDKSSTVFTNAVLIICATGVGSLIASALQSGLFELCLGRLQIRISNKLFAALMRQEVAFYDVTRTGEITSRLTSDTTTMCEALSLNAKIFIQNLLETVIILVFMVQLSWRLTMVTVIGFPVLLGISEIYGDFYKNLSVKVQDSLAEVNDVAQEACSSIRTVRSFGNEKGEVLRYATGLKATYKLKVKEAQASAGFVGCTDFLDLALEVAILYYGGHLAMKNQLTVGHFMSFVLYQLNLGWNLNNMASVYPGLMEAVGASQKVFEFIDRKPTISHEDGKLAPETLKGKLEFKDVTFTYPSRPDNPVLQNMSFSVSPGEIVALVGPSGGGKSTIVSLLEHFYETDSGQVLLDGVPIKEYDHEYVHTKITLVGQEPVLYARSIQENIAYGMETFSPGDVERAARQANAHDFITEMKKKYDTETGEKGLQLSGGQKQRVAIARALIRNPAVLLLDEATSALDSESEHMVQEAIYKNLKGRTVIIVAHRLSTVEKADRIIVINKGKVAEEGTHTQLLMAGGMYAGLVKRQMLTFDANPA